MHLNDGSTELHDKSLDKLHALLPPVFERIHKSYIVKMSAVTLRNGLTLPVGRTRYKQIREKLKG